MRKQAGLLFLLKLLKVPLNILLLSLAAKYFGVSLEKDVWLLAFSTITVIDLAIWGPVNETFRTKFITIKEIESQQKALEDTQSLITYFIVFSMFLVIVIYLFPLRFSEIIAPEYNMKEREVLVNMLYYVAPMLLLNQLMQIGLSILNAFEIFNIAEVSAFFSTVINIILLIFLAEGLGIYALVVAQYISTFLLLAFIVYFLRRKNIQLITLRSWNIRFSGFKMFFLFALPFFVPYFFGQINGIVEKILAGKMGEGTISILDFSNRIPNLLYGIIISIITTILVPILSTAFLRKDSEKFNEEFRKIFQMGILAIGFIIAFISGSSFALVSFIYDKGSIDQQSLLEISELSIFYSITLLGVFTYIIFGMALLSSQNQKKYATMGVFTQIGVLVLNIVFFKMLGKYIFPISMFISHLFFGILMYIKYPFRESLQLSAVKYSSLIIILSFILFFLGKYLKFENNLMNILASGFFSFVCLFFLSFIFKIEERILVQDFLKSKKNNFRI